MIKFPKQEHIQIHSADMGLHDDNGNPICRFPMTTMIHPKMEWIVSVNLHFPHRNQHFVASPTLDFYLRGGLLVASKDGPSANGSNYSSTQKDGFNTDNLDRNCAHGL